MDLSRESPHAILPEADSARRRNARNGVLRGHTLITTTAAKHALAYLRHALMTTHPPSHHAHEGLADWVSSEHLTTKALATPTHTLRQLAPCG